jgi:5-methylcytosine-specific restriction endonuclease McrA
MNSKQKRAIGERAHGCCEYCHLPVEYSEEPFNSDHIIAKQHRGGRSLDNAAFACGRCNRKKGPNIAAIDPVTNRLVPLFNPRINKWKSHFKWEGLLLKDYHPLDEQPLYCSISTTVNGPH